MADAFDLIILGGGPGGYVAAERAGERGLSVALVEQEHLGGVCLNWGCVPTKTLLHSGKVFYQAAHGEAVGVLGGAQLRFDFAAAQQRKQGVIDGLRKGIAGLMKKNKVTVVNGKGMLTDAHTVRVGECNLTGKHILLATGSSPARPPIPGADLPHVVDSTGILALPQAPASLCIVGGGVIGCEFACFFAMIGVPVTVVEMAPEICPGIDPACAQILRQSLESKGVLFLRSAKVTSISADAVHLETSAGAQQVPAACVLLSVGRVPNTQGLGLETAGVATERGRVVVDERCRTSVAHIYACGDVTGKILLAHVASRQGEVAVDTICGGSQRMRYHAIPSVVYTSPEIAAVGLTKAQAEAAGKTVKTATVPMAVSGRYLAENPGAKGQCTVVVDAQSRVLLGVHLVGNGAGEIIHGAAIAIEAELRVQELTEVVFPHPTVAEVWREALLHL